MSANRWFHACRSDPIAAAVLTIAGAIAAYDLASASGAAMPGCRQLSTIHRADDGQRGPVVIAAVPSTGVDGSLLAIIEAARAPETPSRQNFLELKQRQAEAAS
jgi:hypothetical protein